MLMLFRTPPHVSHSLHASLLPHVSLSHSERPYKSSCPIQNLPNWPLVPTYLSVPFRMSPPISLSHPEPFHMSPCPIQNAPTWPPVSTCLAVPSRTSPHVPPSRHVSLSPHIEAQVPLSPHIPYPHVPCPPMSPALPCPLTPHVPPSPHVHLSPHALTISFVPTCLLVPTCLPIPTGLPVQKHNPPCSQMSLHPRTSP